MTARDFLDALGFFAFCAVMGACFWLAGPVNEAIMEWRAAL